MYEFNNLRNQRIISLGLLAFAGFMRKAKLLNIKVCDIQFYEIFMAFFFETSKTDKYRDGAWITVARTNTYLCPVNNLETFIKRAGLNDNDYVFCTLSKKKSGFVVRKNNKVLSYSTFRDEFTMVFKPCVCDIYK